jgi:hypothetical protein
MNNTSLTTFCINIKCGVLILLYIRTTPSGRRRKSSVFGKCFNVTVMVNLLYRVEKNLFLARRNFSNLLIFCKKTKCKKMYVLRILCT